MAVSYPPALNVSDGPAKDPSEKFFVPSSGGGGAITIFYDSFTDTPGTLLTAHDPETVESPATGRIVQISGAGLGDIDATGTRLSSTVGSGNSRIFTADMGISDGISYTTGMTANCGLVFRLADASNYWMLFRVQSGTSEILYQRSSGSYLNRGTSTVGGAGAFVPWAVLFNGADITAYNGGTARITYGSAPASSDTQMGFQRETSGTDVAEDITVKNSTDPSELP